MPAQTQFYFMKKNLLDLDSKDEIINRIKRLTPVATAAWGHMRVNEMMFHCLKINNEILKGKQTDNKPTIKQKLIKAVGLKLLTKFPKGIQTGSRYLGTETDTADFDKVKNDLIESINRAAKYKDSIYGNHPFFGPLNTLEWRRFIWMHMDHHLRQFLV